MMITEILLHRKKEHCKAVNVKKGKRKAIYKSFICQQHENEKNKKKREKWTLF